MPALLADIKYADFSKSFDEGLENLLEGLRIKEENERLKALAQDLKAALESAFSK